MMNAMPSTSTTVALIQAIITDSEMSPQFEPIYRMKTPKFSIKGKRDNPHRPRQKLIAVSPGSSEPTNIQPAQPTKQ